MLEGYRRQLENLFKRRLSVPLHHDLRQYQRCSTNTSLAEHLIPDDCLRFSNQLRNWKVILTGMLLKLVSQLLPARTGMNRSP